MKRNRSLIDQIKNFESDHQIVNIFSEKEIKMLQELYAELPLRVFNKGQNVIKKMWAQKYNEDLDKIYFKKLKSVLGDFKMDNLQDEDGKDFYGIFHESFSPLPIHVDSGFRENDLIYKQILTPLSSFGETIVYKKKWYGKSTLFTIDKKELKFEPGYGQNDRSDEHIGMQEFDKEVHKKYLRHLDINNLKGMEINFIYEWKLGESMIMDRSNIHCSSSNIKDKKLGITTFTKK